MSDDINHPAHYTSHPSGIECIEVTEHLTFNVGNAIKYLWRAGLKSPDAVKDLKKAAWYVNREIYRLSNGQKDSTEKHGASASPTANGARTVAGDIATRFPTGGGG